MTYVQLWLVVVEVVVAYGMAVVEVEVAYSSHMGILIHLGISHPNWQMLAERTQFYISHVSECCVANTFESFNSYLSVHHGDKRQKNYSIELHVSTLALLKQLYSCRSDCSVFIWNDELLMYVMLNSNITRRCINEQHSREFHFSCPQ